jgi:archaeal flagellar protein FlaI
VVDTQQDAVGRNPHLQQYLDAWTASGKPAPAFYSNINRDLKKAHPYNFLYPVGDPIFVHVHELDDGSMFPRYIAVMPSLDETEKPLYDALQQQVFLRSPEVATPESSQEYATALEEILKRIFKKGKIEGTKGATLTDTFKEKARFLLFRDIVEHGTIEPVMRDTWIEDIHSLGTKHLHVVHKVFGMVDTNIQFQTQDDVNGWLEVMGERMGRPISDSSPIVDGALPNGSRINAIFGDAVSKGGSSFTIRKFSDVPMPVTQLVAWNTFSAREAAYLWLCLENNMSVFVAGETASGKTTSLNSILPFIKPRSKILTAEDTPEVLPPHENWQQLITRDRGKSESSVTMYDLLKAALRSRPNYIIVGEIRGAEGGVAFQAMQTGHATMATFHASSVGKLIQRFSSDPINVPLPFMSNLNVVLIQMAVYVHGKMLRRVLALEEIEGYSKTLGKPITRQIFSWDSVKDRHVFAGRNNSYVLESLVAPKMGLADSRDVYKELDKRTMIIEEMIRRKMFDYHKVGRILNEYGEKGEAALPFRLAEVEAVG